MTYLIDTHILIWYVNGNWKLSDKLVNEIISPQNQILISKASLWEVAIKLSLNKLEMRIPFEDLEVYLQKKQIEVLDFIYDDLVTIKNLPFHHRDPFDRLIISQAINRNFIIITDDAQFKKYSVQLL